MPPQKPPPFTRRELLGIAALVVAIAVVFEVDVGSPGDVGLGLMRVAIAVVLAAGLFLLFGKTRG